MNTDQYYMSRALMLAALADEENEVPVGAVVVCNDQIIGKGYNQTQQLEDATAHAEMLAITSASAFLHSRHLQKCTLYVTLEPCPMCASAINWAQVERVVYGAEDEKRGYRSFSPKLIPPKVEIKGGVLHQECEALLMSFFKRLRK
ncbi:nucleoside deaminase [Rapidithrix thailandica]|uniref:tRNA-specific adenosine deaminase n=1 Tax=Rapidithrix thailandica TaxID=413964 RepID=A0AAW9S2F3_9BACT